MTIMEAGLVNLPLETRLLRYHEMREAALERAGQAATDAERENLQRIAGEWRLLAQETERLLREIRPR